METISRSEARKLIEGRQDLAVLEVLDPKSFESCHLPRARNVPLDDSFDRNVKAAVPEKTTPILLYCMDAECEASSKAAARLEKLGYTEIYDYEAGKTDWREAGLPVEGQSGPLS